VTDLAGAWKVTGGDACQVAPWSAEVSSQPSHSELAVLDEFPALNSPAASVPGPFALVVEFRLASHVTDPLPALLPRTVVLAGRAGSGGVPVPEPRLTAAVHASVESGASAQALPR
jgi:hypothetical protein